jgi:beta-lactamase class A
MAWDEIHQLIRAAEQSDGMVGVALIAPSGERFAHRGARRFRAASTVKIPIMVELFRQIERGEQSLTTRYVLQDEDRTPGTGVLLHLHAGLELTLEDLVYLMISISDNSATNVLINLVGMDNVNRTMRDLGMSHSTLGRLMKGRRAAEDEQENWATPDDYASSVEAILHQRAVQAGSCDAMLALLEKQQSTNRISRYLPPGVRWGSKIGQIDGVTNDVGFVLTEGGSLVVSVFCEGLPDQHVAEKFIGDLTRAALKATRIATPLETS